MKETYWDQIPKKGIITEHSTIIGSLENKPKNYKIQTNSLYGKVQTVPTIGPHEPWPEAPEGYKWSILGIEPTFINPYESYCFYIKSYRLFQTRFLFLAGSLRYLFITEMNIEGCVQSCSIKDIPASMFRRPAPWTLDTLSPSSYIMLTIRNDNKYCQVSGGLIGLTLK